MSATQKHEDDCTESTTTSKESPLGTDDPVHHAEGAGCTSNPTSGGARSTNPAAPSYNFNWVFMKRFWRLHGIFFPGWCSGNVALFMLLLLVCGLEQFLAYEVGIMAGQFFKVLGAKDLDGFKLACIKNLLIIGAISVTKSIRVFSTRLLSVGWRQTLTQAMHKLYLSSANFYRLNVLDQKIDNPDQRMTSDVNSVVQSYSDIIAKLVVIPFTIVYYTFDAYNRAGWVGPTGMYGLFVVSTIVNKLVMKPVVQMTAEREKREGDLRFKHMQLRASAESLAFHGSSSFEMTKVNNKLLKVCEAQQSLYNRQLAIDVSVNLFSYLGGVASYLVIAVPIFSGVYDNLSGAELSQVISENSFVCLYLVFQLTQLVEMTSTVAGLAGSTHRVSEMIEVLAQYHLDKDWNNSINNQCAGQPGGPAEVIVTDNQHQLCQKMEQQELLQNGSSSPNKKLPLVEFRRVWLSPPNSEVNLVNDLSLQLEASSSLLIIGPSSAGKSSLLRALRGLWKLRYGEIIIHPEVRRRMFFLPQRPFFTTGSLREQIVYPLEVAIECPTNPDEDAKILDLLTLINMSGLIDRCGGLDREPSWNWADILSPGEQQRLAFIRLLYHNPVLAVLDEATSALSEDMETKLYEECVKRGIALLSVGHRAGLKRFHQWVLELGTASLPTAPACLDKMDTLLEGDTGDMSKLTHSSEVPEALLEAVGGHWQLSRTDLAAI